MKSILRSSADNVFAGDPLKNMSDSPTQSRAPWGQLLSGLAVVLVLALLLKVGCDRQRVQSHPNSGLDTVAMPIGSKTFNLEIANNDESRQRGLMRRDSMPDDHGMIFVFPEEEEQSFWMKNTRIPLDIIYIAANGYVVSIKDLKPYDTRGVSSERPAKYAIELNAGAATDAGVQVGDELTIPAAARETDR